MFHEDILKMSYHIYIYISKLHFCLVICIAKNFIWTTSFGQQKAKVLFIFFAPSDSRFSNSCISAKYDQILTNHTSMESVFIMIHINLEKNTLKTGFVVQGHKFVSPA